MNNDDVSQDQRNQKKSRKVKKLWANKRARRSRAVTVFGKLKMGEPIFILSSLSVTRNLRTKRKISSA
jgi:hypothetical protein